MAGYNLYLITRPDAPDYDEFDSAVVCAKSEEEARMIHPGCYDWDGKASPHDSWVDADKVTVELLGKAKMQFDPVVCASFNAG